MSNVEFIYTNDNEIWDKLVLNSVDGTIFHTSEYLKSINDIDYKFLLLKYKGTLRAGFLILLNKNSNNEIIKHHQIIYSGVIFSQTKGIRKTKIISDSFVLLTELSNYLEKNYKKISFCLSPSIKDIRPFKWHNYGEKDRRYQIEVRYTTQIVLDESIMNSKSGNNLFGNLEPVRRYSLRKAIKGNAKFDFVPNIEEAMLHYKNMMKPYWEELNSLDDLINTIGKSLNILKEKNLLRTCNVYNENNALSYIVFYIFDNKKAYYLHGIKTKNTGPYDGTYANWLIWQNFYREGIVKTIDLEGVNSPNRGWFKLSFGGELINYYAVTLE